MLICQRKLKLEYIENENETKTRKKEKWQKSNYEKCRMKIERL